MMRTVFSLVAAVRFGGNFTSGYHGRDGVGPLDQRRPMLNPAWGIPEYNPFGTDELLRFCRLIGAEPQIGLESGQRRAGGDCRLGPLCQPALG